MSLMCIDLYETDGLLLFRSKSIIFQTIDLERVIKKAENIFNFYLDFNWELRFIELQTYKHFRRNGHPEGRPSPTVFCIITYIDSI